MDTHEKVSKNPNPAQKANPLSALMFLYMFPIFKRTCKRGFTEDDLFEPLREHKSSTLGDKLEETYRRELKKHKNMALHLALFKLFKFSYILTGISRAIDELILVVVMPLSVGKLVRYFEEGQTEISDDEAYMYTGAIMLCLLMSAFVAHPSMMALQHVAMKMRVACSSLIYRKTLRLSRSALNNTTVGQVINLLSNDVNKFDQGFSNSHMVWIAPLQVAVGTYLIYTEIGVIAFYGIAFLLVFIPVQIWIGKQSSVLRLRTAQRTDERVRLMNEVISGIHVIKMYCWEKPFAKLISLARREEMKVVRQHAYLMGTFYSFEAFVTRTSIFISLITYVLLNNMITAQKVFAITAIYNVLRGPITVLFSLGFIGLAEMHVSIKRLHDFLSLDENEQNTKKSNLLCSITDSKAVCEKEVRPRITFKNMSAKWLPDSSENTLDDININITSNQLVAVIGPVGSGKSSILSAILKELPITGGDLMVDGKISYACQEPWLFSGSVRNNIVFNNEYNEERYKEVVSLCALESDFALFPHGDSTLVGERGKSLSGGQKARINLARCIYKEADIYLLDDPLSAVDVNVGQHLFRNCIKQFLKDKICILVTHQLQHLKHVDKIVLLSDGEILAQGSYRELCSSGVDIATLLGAYSNVEEEKEKKIKSRQASQVDLMGDEEEIAVVEEKLASGKIDFSVYWRYLRAGGGFCMVFLLFLSFVMRQFITNAGDYFVTYWVNKEEDYALPMHQNETLDRDTIMYIYSGIIGSGIFLTITQSLYFMVFFTIASVKLHEFIFSKTIQATMRFFNNNPSGRILNRFAKDLGIIDEYLPLVFFDVVEIGLFITGVVVLSCLVQIWLLPPTLLLMGIFYLMRMVYIKTSRCVKRIEAVTKSPIFNHITASMCGLSTIRAFGAERILIHEFDRYQDNHSGAWFLFIASSRSFGFWLDLFCALFIGAATFCLVIFSKGTYGGEIGLVITQYFSLIGSLQWGMRQWSELENQMTSVERVLEYTRLETEPKRTKSQELPKEWPSQGKIEFREVYLRYEPSDPHVLKNLNFVINPSEKIGIVGRTGAGKSSIITALFQLYEIEGSIFIDDIDTTKLPLEEVRSKIAIIPQEPVLFSGTMRRNLDPFEEFDDEVLWGALEQVEMKEVVADLPNQLSTNVSEGGSNFSVGQRQLICLARALIRNNRILVLDEATANVDPQTDGLIQKTIRDKFLHCTVLTIAHRLHTVMDSDKILVMNAGYVEEFDHPYMLLQNKYGFLRNLVDMSGGSTARTLESIAEESFEKKKA